MRDALLGSTPHDYDFATSALPDQTERAFRAAGFETYGLGKRFGTVVARVGDFEFEVTTYRKDSTTSDGRRPDFVEFVPCLTEDLARRDFTVNAMALDRDGKLADPFGGSQDLARKLVRCVGEPSARFEEDALRVLRAVRFAAVLGFEVDKATGEAAVECAREGKLDAVSRERCRDELLKLLGAEDEKAVERVLLDFREVVCAVLPELEPCVDYDQTSPYHAYDLYTHSVKTAVGVKASLPFVRLVGLLHDVGKPSCRLEVVDAGGVDGQVKAVYRGHGKVGAELVRNALVRLRFSSKLVDKGALAVEVHDRELGCGAKGLLRFARRAGGFEDALDVLELVEADTLAHGDARCVWDGRLDDVRKAREFFAAKLVEAPFKCAVSGKDLLKVGFLPGPVLGDVLKAVKERAEAGEVANEKEVLVEEALKVLRGPRDEYSNVIDLSVCTSAKRAEYLQSIRSRIDRSRIGSPEAIARRNEGIRREMEKYRPVRF